MLDRIDRRLDLGQLSLAMPPLLLEQAGRVGGRIVLAVAAARHAACK